MPLLDHFHPPLSRTHPWRGFHGAWAAAMARLLNRGVLPPGYYAVPFVDQAGPIEIDIATLRQPTPAEDAPGAQPWTPPAPELTVTVDLSTLDAICIDVMTDDGDPRVVAAVELVSPRNKDRPTARQAFVSKCVEHLRRGCGLVVVDIVTTRRADLHGELLAALQGDVEAASPLGLSAVAYVAALEGEETRLAVWTGALTLGQPLPTLPLWLGPDLSIRLDLESSYDAACVDLRVRVAG